MKGSQNIRRADQHAKTRDRKRQPKMKVSGKSVFALQKLKDKPRR